MQKELKNLLKLITALGTVILFFSVARVYFYFNNQDYFNNNIDFTLVKSFIYGFENDFKFIFAINSIIVLLFFLPLRLRNTIFWQFIVKFSFTVLNSGLILIYLIDSKYYSVVGEHIKLFETDNLGLYEQFISAFNKINLQYSNSWDIILAIIFTIIVMWTVFPSINKMYFEKSKSNLYFRFFISLVAAFLIWKTINEINDKSGNWQLKHFKQINRHSSVLALNSPYFLLRYYKAEKLKSHKFFDKNEIKTLFSINKKYYSRKENKKDVIIINCSKSINNWKNIESRIKKQKNNYYISNNFSKNSTNSLHKMDEILLSFPSFEKKPLIKTIYAFNEFKSIAQLLKKNNYYTILASNNDSKSLNKSYKNFYGFNSSVFNKNVNRLFERVETEIKENTDNNNFFVFYQINSGLEEVLDNIRDNELYGEAIIVVNLNIEQKNGLFTGKTIYLLPKSVDKDNISVRTQSVDIFPSIIDYLNIDEKFKSFGKSVFYKSENQFVFQFTGSDYLILQDSLLLRYNGQSTKWIIDYKNDPDEFFDLQDSLPVQKVILENKIRAIIQENNQSLINNDMIIKP